MILISITSASLSTWVLSCCFTYFQFALPYIRKSKGNIINNSSLVASLGQDGALAYAATKVRLNNNQLFVINPMTAGAA